jgi:outer membrane protein OmpA-like peptidoglycan-associated protein
VKSIDLSESVSAAFSAAILQHLSEKIGLSGAILQRVVVHAGPVLIASLMAGASTSGGVTALYDAIISSGSNARIEDQFSSLCATTAGLKDLEATGDALMMRATGRRIAGASDQIATQTGIPMQAAHVLTGLVAAVLFGALKRHVLLEQATSAGLPALLGGQLPAVSSYMTDSVAASIGFENAGSFASEIAGKLEGVSANLTRPLPTDEPVPRPSAPVPLHSIAASSTSTWSFRKRIWSSIVVLLAVLLGLFAYGYFHSEPASPQPVTPLHGSRDRPVTPAITSTASTVTAQPVTGSSAPGMAAGASVTAPASAVSASAPAAASAPKPASLPLANLPARDAQLVFRVNQVGVPALTGTVSSDAEKQALTDALTRKIGVGRFTADLSVDAGTQPAEWLSHVDDLVPLMVLSRAEVAIEGKHVELSGAAENAALGWRQRLQTVFGPSWDIGQFNAAQAVDSSTVSFLKTMANLLAKGGSCAATDVGRVLDLQVVDFENSSGHVPSSAKENLTESAQLLKACADSGKAVNLEITAYSDNVGDPLANLDLSKKRAEAVREFLVNAGAPASSLTAEGSGATHPVASNATAMGRFENRRIEFTARQ